LEVLANLKAWLGELRSRWTLPRWVIVGGGLLWWLADNRWDIATRVNAAIDDDAIPGISKALEWFVTNLLSGVGIIAVTISGILLHAWVGSRIEARNVQPSVALGLQEPVGLSIGIPTPTTLIGTDETQELREASRSLATDIFHSLRESPNPGTYLLGDAQAVLDAHQNQRLHNRAKYGARVSNILADYLQRGMIDQEEHDLLIWKVDSDHWLVDVATRIEALADQL
jgi:hypothetical protein